jgi:hypothetical protein
MKCVVDSLGCFVPARTIARSLRLTVGKLNKRGVSNHINHGDSQQLVSDVNNKPTCLGVAMSIMKNVASFILLPLTTLQLALAVQDVPACLPPTHHNTPANQTSAPSGFGFQKGKEWTELKSY